MQEAWTNLEFAKPDSGGGNFTRSDLGFYEQGAEDGSNDYATYLKSVPPDQSIRDSYFRTYPRI
jgi:hypothetical protein